jgi:hypothetical protein
MKVYLTFEYGDYGLWDTSSSKVFTTREAAEAYCKQYQEESGWGMEVAEFEVE